MYYNLNLAWDPKVIGVKNGVYQVELDTKACSADTFEVIKTFFLQGKLNAQQELPELDFKFYFKKLRSAKKTCFISFCPHLKHCKFLVHKNTLALMRQFNLQKHKDFESVIYDSPTLNLDDNYRLFYLVLQDWNVIDFKNTIFTSGGFGKEPKVEHSFIDENDMRQFHGITQVKALALNKEFDRSLDLFLTRLGGVFVSEKLKVALEKCNASGLYFLDKVQVEI